MALFQDELYRANEIFKKNKLSILQEITNDITILKYVNYQYRKNLKFMIKAIKINIKAVDYADIKLYKNKKFMKEVVLQCIANKNIVKENDIEKFDNENFLFSILCYKKVLHKWIDDDHNHHLHYWLYDNISNRLLQNIDFIKILFAEFYYDETSNTELHLDYEQDYFITDYLSDNEDFIIFIVDLVQAHGFRCASTRLKDNAEFIIRMVNTINPQYHIFPYISERLRDNEEFILEFFKSYELSNHWWGEIIPDMSSRLQNDENFILQLVKKNSVYDDDGDDDIINYSNEIIRDSRKIILECIKSDYQLNEKESHMYHLFYSGSGASDRLKKHFINYTRRRNYFLFLLHNHLLNNIKSNSNTNNFYTILLDKKLPSQIIELFYSSDNTKNYNVSLLDKTLSNEVIQSTIASFL